MTALWPCTLGLQESHRPHQCSTGTFTARSHGWRKPARAGGKDNSRKQRAKQPPFSPLLLALVMFILTDPSQNGVTTSETNSKSDYFLYLFKQCQCWIYFPQKDSRQWRTGWFLHQRTKKIALVLHRQLRLLLKAEANPTQVLLFSLHSRTDLPQNFTGLQQEPGGVFQQLLYHSRATAYLFLIH